MAVAKNSITGDSIQSRPTNKEYEEKFTSIFGEKKKEDDSEYWAKLAEETALRMAQFDLKRLVESQSDCD